MSRSSRSSSRARPPRPTPRAEAGKHRASGAGDQLASLVPWRRCCGSVRCSMTAARRGLGDRGVRRRFRRRGGRVRVRARVELGVPRRGRLPAAGPPAALGGAAGLRSDVLGFDTAVSTDHGWGPRTHVFVALAEVDTVRRRDPSRRAGRAGQHTRRLAAARHVLPRVARPLPACRCRRRRAAATTAGRSTPRRRRTKGEPVVSAPSANCSAHIKRISRDAARDQCVW
jgi:hypothetical protein